MTPRLRHGPPGAIRPTLFPRMQRSRASGTVPRAGTFRRLKKETQWLTKWTHSEQNGSWRDAVRTCRLRPVRRRGRTVVRNPARQQHLRWLFRRLLGDEERAPSPPTRACDCSSSCPGGEASHPSGGVMMAATKRRNCPSCNSTKTIVLGCIDIRTDSRTEYCGACIKCRRRFELALPKKSPSE